MSRLRLGRWGALVCCVGWLVACGSTDDTPDPTSSSGSTGSGTTSGSASSTSGSTSSTSGSASTTSGTTGTGTTTGAATTSGGAGSTTGSPLDAGETTGGTNGGTSGATGGADAAGSDASGPSTRADGGPSDAAPSDGPQGEGGTCAAARQGWNDLRTMLLPNAQKCTQDTDCIFASFDDDCGSICPTPIGNMTIGDFGNALYSYAADHCSGCPAVTPPDCMTPANMAVGCSGGVCAWKN